MSSALAAPRLWIARCTHPRCRRSIEAVGENAREARNTVRALGDREGRWTFHPSPLCPVHQSPPVFVLIYPQCSRCGNDLSTEGDGWRCDTCHFTWPMAAHDGDAGEAECTCWPQPGDSPDCVVHA